MEFANQTWFDRFDALLMAKGASPATVILDAKGNPVATSTNGGLINPTAFALQPGRTIYRFGNILTNGRGTLATPVEGQWWLEDSEMRAIEKFADTNRIGIPLAVRLLCSVPEDWSDMQLLVAVRLMKPLMAYRGPGATGTGRSKSTGVQQTLTPILDLGGAIINQLYVPGLSNGDLRREAVLQCGSRFFSPEAGMLP